MQHTEIEMKLRFDGLDEARLCAVSESLCRLDGDFALVGAAILARLGSTAEARRRRRDATIVELREKFFQDVSFTQASIALETELSRFAASPRWLHVCDLPEPPEYRGTQNELLYRIMRHGGPIRERQIRNVLTIAQRQSSSLAIAGTSVATSEHVHET